MLPSIAIVVPCRNEAENLKVLLPQINGVIRYFDNKIGVYVVHGDSIDDTARVAEALGATAIAQRGRGYGAAIRTALQQLDADLVITLDADCSHPPAVLKRLMASIDQAEIVIASRYIAQGYARAPFFRKLLSIVLNLVFRTVLSIPVRDISSGYRAYKRKPVSEIPLEMDSFAFLPEAVVKAYIRGYRILEVPFHYQLRAFGKSNAQILAFGLQYLKLMGQFWSIRNSVACADYDTRAFFSRIPLQRWWQRKRYRIVCDMVGNSLSVLDVGCGSGQILNGLQQIVGMDPQINKLLFMRAPGRLLVRGSIFAIPFADASVETLICSQVIEHLPKSDAIFSELVRCLAPGGILILGTVDYGRWQWPLIEKLYAMAKPGGYAEEHITHYTERSLLAELARWGLEVLDVRFIAKAEIIIKAKKPGASAGPAALITPRTFDRILACPRDRSALTRNPQSYSCTQCGREYPITDSIPDLMVT